MSHPGQNQEPLTEQNLAHVEDSIDALIEHGAVFPIEGKIKPAIFEEIGMLSTITVMADLALADQLLRLISLDRDVMSHAYPLVAGMDFKVKVNIYRVFVSAYIKDLTDRKTMNKLLDRLESAYGRRNDLAHGLITAGRKNPDEIWLQITKPKVKLGRFPSRQVVKRSEIRRWAWQIYIYASQLSGCLDQLGFGKSFGPDLPKVPLSASQKSIHQGHTARPKPKQRRP